MMKLSDNELKSITGGQELAEYLDAFSHPGCTGELIQAHSEPGNNAQTVSAQALKENDSNLVGLMSLIQQII